MKIKVIPQLVYVDGAKPYEITRNRAAYLIRAARSRNGEVSRDVSHPWYKGYKIADSQMEVMV